MLCPTCEFNIPDDSIVCRNCGNPVKKPDANKTGGTQSSFSPLARAGMYSGTKAAAVSAAVSAAPDTWSKSSSGATQALRTVGWIIVVAGIILALGVWLLLGQSGSFGVLLGALFGLLAFAVNSGIGIFLIVVADIADDVSSIRQNRGQ